MPFNVSEEQSLLSSMLAERDAQISTLTHQLHSTSEILHTTQKELQSKSSARKAQREEHSATIKRLKEEHAEQRRVLAKFEQNVKNGGGLRVHEYAALMRSANGGRVESSYVIRLQAQLCRAMHSLGVMESQLALVKENCSSLIKFMKEDLSHMVDDRTRREIELMNGLARVDGEKRVMAQEMEAKMQEKEELLDQVREEYEELGLEYDENEVKRALEVKYLLEQMEKVREDKVRLEKELLAALLEREEQINRLKRETEEMGNKLEGLKKEAEKRDIRYGEDAAVVTSDSENDDGGAAQEEDDEIFQEDGKEEEGGEVIGGQGGKEDTISGVTSQSENAIKDETQATEEGTMPIGVEEDNQNEGIQSDDIEGEIEATAQESHEGSLEEEPPTASTDEANIDDGKPEDPEPVEGESPTASTYSASIGGRKLEDSELEEGGPPTASKDDANIDDGTVEKNSTANIEGEENDDSNEASGDVASEGEMHSEPPQDSPAGDDPEAQGKERVDEPGANASVVEEGDAVETLKENNTSDNPPPANLEDVGNAVPETKMRIMLENHHED